MALVTPERVDWELMALPITPRIIPFFLGGHPYEQKIAEITIPQSLSGSTAAVVQNLKDPLEGKLGSVNPSDPNQKIIGSAFVYNNNLYIGGYSYYDGAATQSKSQFVRPTNLSTTGQVQGPFTVGNKYPGWVDKYAAVIPTEWQSLFGGPVIVGGSGGAINSLQSWGPSASVIIPADIGSKNPIPATLVLGYPYGNPLNETNVGNPYWSQATVITGMVFPKELGVSSILVSMDLGHIVMAPERSAMILQIAQKARTHILTSLISGRIDANDLIAVKNGQKQSWAKSNHTPLGSWTRHLLTSKGLVTIPQPNEFLFQPHVKTRTVCR